MTVHIQVYSDYVCPFCYIAEVPLREAAMGQDVEVHWMPYELRPFPEATLRTDDEYLPRVWEESVYPMAEQYGVNIVLPQVSPQPYTHLAFEGFQYAKEHGQADEYNHLVFKAFFERELNIGEVEVLTGLAGELGLDEKEFRESLESRAYRNAHREAVERAYQEADITVVPTFIIGGTVLRGVQSKETLEQVIREEQFKQPKFTLIGGEGMSCGMDGCN